jgi:hypothetical protein
MAAPVPEIMDRKQSQDGGITLLEWLIQIIELADFCNAHAHWRSSVDRGTTVDWVGIWKF